jgi:glucose-6-phosphate 1-dehydrogenase
LVILKDLKRRIEGLRQAYVRQREEARSWELVDKIIEVLDKGCKFLEFPMTNPA